MTKSFASKLSPCKQFGLITTSKGTIQLTEACKCIIFPTGEDITSIIQACFGMPPLYAKLIAAYDGKAIPSTELLADILMNVHKIQKTVKDNAAQVFIESAEQLGLIKGGVLCCSNVESDTASPQTQYSKKLNSTELNQDPTPSTPDPYVQAMPVFSSRESDYITQIIPFESGKIARLIVPVDATEDNLLLLRDIFDVLLKRKFKIQSK